MKGNPQVCSTITEELYLEIEQMAKKEGRSVSNMAGVLLQAAVNERNRRKKKKSDGLQPGKS